MKISSKAEFDQLLIKLERSSSIEVSSRPQEIDLSSYRISEEECQKIIRIIANLGDQASWYKSRSYIILPLDASFSWLRLYTETFDKYFKTVSFKPDFEWLSSTKTFSAPMVDEAIQADDSNSSGNESEEASSETPEIHEILTPRYNEEKSRELWDLLSKSELHPDDRGRVVELIRDKTVDINFSTGIFHRSIIQCALPHKDMGLLKEILTRQPDVLFQDSNKANFLHIACMVGDYGFLQSLLKVLEESVPEKVLKDLLNMENEEGLTPFYSALQHFNHHDPKGCYDFMVELEKSGADIDHELVREIAGESAEEFLYILPS